MTLDETTTTGGPVCYMCHGRGVIRSGLSIYVSNVGGTDDGIYPLEVCPTCHGTGRNC